MGDFLEQLPDSEKARLDTLPIEQRDDTVKGVSPGSERADEEDRLFKASLSEDEQLFLESHLGLGNSQKAEVAWLEMMGYEYECHDIRDFQG
jgi:hypothetical protein